MSLSFVLNILPVSPMHFISQLGHGTSYTISQVCSFSPLCQRLIGKRSQANKKNKKKKTKKKTKKKKKKKTQKTREKKKKKKKKKKDSIYATTLHAEESLSRSQRQNLKKKKQKKTKQKKKKTDIHQVGAKSAVTSHTKVKRAENSTQD